VIDPAAFATRVTNAYFPLRPGTVRTYDGTRDGAPEHVQVTVTRGTRTIAGVRCVVVSDIVTSNNTLVEKTTDWYAQDRAGNVWYFGEDSAEYRNGVVTSTQGTWEAGVDNAQPGIVMPARPVVGRQYRQEFRPGVAEDMATIERLDDRYGPYRTVLRTYDTDPLNPDKIEHKWYAPGVGMVSAIRQGSAHHEKIELTSVTR
jgi:hypothetical protein